jgi:hypothetical protein
MFHVVYSRHYWDTEDQGQFTNTWTVMRNCSYGNLHNHSSALEGYKRTCDEQYEEHAEKNNISSDNFFQSECYIIDDEEYFKTYQDEYPDSYQGSPGLIPAEEDYFHDYGQKSTFMLVHDFNRDYTWFGKDLTQEEIEKTYSDRDNGKDIYAEWREKRDLIRDFVPA